MPSAKPVVADPVLKLAEKLSLPAKGIRAVLELLAGGATVPFIARYRKEATSSLDEVQIRAIAEAHKFFVELEARRDTILRSLEEQGITDSELLQEVRSAQDRTFLEDLYLPHKPKRRTKASVALELGLGPLAERVLEQPRNGNVDGDARGYLCKDLKTTEDVLSGVNDILVEWIAQDVDTRDEVRNLLWQRGECRTKATKEASKDSKFRDYFDFSERAQKIKGYRYLAMRRGEAAGELRFSIDIDGPDVPSIIARHFKANPRSPFVSHLEKSAKEAYSKRLKPSLTKEVRGELDKECDKEAVEVFANNLRDLLLASPLGPKAVIGIDPGLRTGCKCVVVDKTGKFLENETLFFEGKGHEKAQSVLKRWLVKHGPISAIAVGNGTGGRQAEAFVREILKGDTQVSDLAKPKAWEAPVVVSVNEAGASVYSASDVAREEFADLDLTVRGAISIARRLQDPLAELVKIEPQAIGVGQYQHDLPPALLEERLGAVVEDCVNQVGVQLNLASQPLLARVAGLGPKQAKAIVEHRDTHGAFGSRRELLKVAGMGPKKYEQCAGFLRVASSKQPLDNSGVHPERYALVESIARDLGLEVPKLIGNREEVARIDMGKYTKRDEVGAATLTDILNELREPGIDPRADFEAPAFRDDVNEISDLEVGMELEGVVTNVADFGAFVDVGVHQDGLVHISRLKSEFVKHPGDVVSVGQRIKVWVLEVDKARKRIALSAVES